MLAIVTVAAVVAALCAVVCAAVVVRATARMEPLRDELTRLRSATQALRETRDRGDDGATLAELRAIREQLETSERRQREAQG